MTSEKLLLRVLSFLCAFLQGKVKVTLDKPDLFSALQNLPSTTAEY